MQKRMVRLDEDNLESVENVKYLGSKVSTGGNIISKFRTRKAKDAITFNSLKNIRKRECISRKTKLNLFRSCVITDQKVGTLQKP